MQAQRRPRRPIRPVLRTLAHPARARLQRIPLAPRCSEGLGGPVPGIRRGRRQGAELRQPYPARRGGRAPGRNAIATARRGGRAARKPVDDRRPADPGRFARPTRRRARATERRVRRSGWTHAARPDRFPIRCDSRCRQPGDRQRGGVVARRRARAATTTRRAGGAPTTGPTSLRSEAEGRPHLPVFETKGRRLDNSDAADKGRAPKRRRAASIAAP